MVSSWLGAGVVAALIGTVATPVLTTRGLAQLARQEAASRGLRLAGALGGGAAGAAAIATSHRAGTWWLLPALLVWGCALVAAACCDAVTQRIPTPLVRQAGGVTCVLLTIGLAVQSDWTGLVISGVAAVVSGLTLLLCWRFAGAGFGDVRLATLGGLGLGHATFRGLLVAVAAFCVIILVQAIANLTRGGNRHSRLPFGPALAAAFLLAAAL
jgi:leader peptidase (prepilin peptidase) / N-methyltransferase